MDTVRRFFCVLGIITLFFIVGCEKKTGPAGTAEETGVTVEEAEPEGEPAEQRIAEEAAPRTEQEREEAEKAEIEAGTAADEGVVTYLSGEVSIQRSEDWNTLDIDDPVSTADTVRTAAESFCEVQFTDFGIIRIKENTEILVQNLFMKEEKNRVGLKLKKGSVLCKVKKLAKDEEFEVTTSTSLAGVRGTEFQVTEGEGETTVVAVKEGEVSVVPVEIVERVEEIRNSARTEPARRVVDEISIPEVIVTEEKEITIEQMKVERAVDDFQEVSRDLEQKVREIDDKALAIEEKQKELPQKSRRERKKDKREMETLQEDIEELTDTVKRESDDNADKIRQVLDEAEDLSDTSREELEEVEQMSQVDVIASAKKSRGRREEKKAQLTRLIVEVEPEDADIVIGGNVVGTGEYRGLFEPGEEIRVRFRKAGYKTEERTLKIASSGEERVFVELKTPVVWRISGSSSAFVRKPLVVGDRVVLADETGTLSCIDARGRLLWKVETGNNPNENSMPVLAGDRVVFSGVAELISADLARGEIFERVDLSKSGLSHHLFGRTVVPLGDRLLYPADEAIHLLNTKTLQETGKISVPDTTAGSPSLRNGNICIVNRRGELLVIEPDSGAVKVRVPTDAFETVAASPTVVGSRAVFADSRGTIVCVDIDAGSVVWHRDLPGAGGRGIYREIDAAGDRLYPYTGSAFYAVSLEEGSVELGPVDSTCQPLVAKGRIYFGDGDARFLVMNERNGRVLKSWTLDSPVTTMPQMWHGGILAATSGGSVYMLNEENL